MKQGKLLAAAIDDFTLAMSNLDEFIHLGNIAVERKELRNPFWFFTELSEKMQVVKNKKNTMIELI